MSQQRPDIAVIIAAWKAATTIGRAVRSALIQPEVKEVIVVDDRSADETLECAKAADDGTGRLSLFSQDRNSGPSAARNRGIEVSHSAYVAILDSDDFFLPGRFEALFENGAFDVIADNIAFVREGELTHLPAIRRLSEEAPRSIDLAAFIAGNLSVAGRTRAELGFMKPIFRRSFIDDHQIRYDERLRLGEDYAFYAEMLAAGARFVRTKACGYVAVERDGSLSGCHRTSDLEALLRFDETLQQRPELDQRALEMLDRHRHQMACKVHHRQVLDYRKGGVLPALAAALGRPRLLPQLALAVARDKLVKSKPDRQEVRYLFD